MTDVFMQAESARRQANGQLYGVVVEVDYDAKRSVVEIEDGWNTAPLPWLERRAGKARTSSPPSVGEQVTVLSPGGETAAGLILLGVPSDAFAPSEVREGLELFETDGGYSDRWDEEAKTRTIDLPEGGELHVTVAGQPAAFVSAEKVELIVGGATATVEDGAITLTVGGASLVIEDGAITLNGDVNLGGKGGKAVARVDDPISTQLNKIVAGSGTVKAK